MVLNSKIITDTSQVPKGHGVLVQGADTHSWIPQRLNSTPLDPRDFVSRIKSDDAQLCRYLGLVVLTEVQDSALVSPCDTTCHLYQKGEWAAVIDVLVHQLEIAIPENNFGICESYVNPGDAWLVWINPNYQE